MALNRSRGFTLIELLVVIAIIGILSSVVLASLNTARDKGVDAAIKGNLDGARTQAALYYDSNTSSYSGVCGTASTTDGVSSINAIVTAAATQAGTSTIYVNATGGAGKTTCNAGPSSWAAEVPLKTGGFYCVDSTGAGTTTSGYTLGNPTGGADRTCG